MILARDKNGDVVKHNPVTGESTPATLGDWFEAMAEWAIGSDDDEGMPEASAA